MPNPYPTRIHIVLNPLFDISRLRDTVAGGALVLTPNLRLARKIHEAWDRDSQQQGLATWLAPRIFAIDSWLEDAWLQLVDGAYAPALEGIPVRAAQERWLWEQVIAADDSAASANPGGFADMARRGWQLVRLWRVPVDTLEQGHHDGAKALTRWGLEWERQVRARGLISQPRRAEIIRQGFGDGALEAPRRICLVGFQSISPLHQAVLDATGGSLEQLPPPSGLARPRHFTAADPDTEIAAAARWALDKVALDPGARIGVVIPDLAQLRDKVERVFLHHFDPGWCWPDQPYRPPAFNISAASPLAEAAPVAAALDLLALNRPRLPVDALLRAVNSPFWGRAFAEGELRSRAAVAILDSGLAEPASGLLRRRLSELESAYYQRFSESQSDSGPGGRLARMADALRHGPVTRSCGGWRQLFEEQLQILGWPGERPLNSLEYQQREHWDTLLDEFQQLDRVAPPVTAEQALRLLEQLAANSPFQAETPDAQVQILGSLEAAGLHFDHLWMMQMDDHHWPEATNPHPLLPVALQRSLAMPKASPERELELGRDLFELFCASAGEVVVSHARQDGDVHFQGSALLSDIESVTLENIDSDHPWTSAIAAAAQLEVITDLSGLPLPASADPLPGAAGFLAAQAGCPFNAFARYRLGAEPLPVPTVGLDPLARGNLIHYSLEALWRDIDGRAALAELSAEERDQHLAAAVDTALARFLRRAQLAARDLGERHLNLEKARIHQLLAEWLEWEVNRPEFTREALEQARELDIDGLKVRMRIDRLDRLGDGSRLIIDYKTGSPSLKSLGHERLAEPQLALYALAVGEPLAAVGYGLIRAKGVRFDGVDTAALPAIGLPETWQLTLEKWHNKLILIKNEIFSGYAPVAFHHPDAAAYGGDLEPLNRWPGRERLARFKASQARPEVLS